MIISDNQIIINKMPILQNRVYPDKESSLNANIVNTKKNFIAESNIDTGNIVLYHILKHIQNPFNFIKTGKIYTNLKYN